MFDSNSAELEGGGINAILSSSGSFKGSTVLKNNSTLNGGGGGGGEHRDQ